MAEIYKLEKPNKKADPDKYLSKLFGIERPKFFGFIDLVSEKDYLYWDVVKYKEPAPTNASREELWEMVKIIRKSKSLISPIKHEDGQYFSWVKLSKMEEFFHEIDMNTGGEIFLDKNIESKKNKQKLIFRGIVEEAIASSQLEGASTSREVAKKFLREGRKPTNQSEQMILNNYLTMKSIEENYKEKNLNMDMLLELHGLITKNTPDVDGEIARIRNKKDEIIVTDNKKSEIIYHKAPNIDFTLKELENLFYFANNSDQFIHPIIKAIMFHFWIGYLHPFTDGNGRLARLIFYWYLLKKGYWAFAYLPISKMIKKSPSQYIMAYVYSEQDDYDMTYFIDYNIKKIKLAVEDFKEYIDRQAKNNITMRKISREGYSFNERQIGLLQYLYGSKEEKTSLKTHINVYQVAKNTALRDLFELSEKGFLEKKKQGRNTYYYPTNKIKALFK